MCGRLHVFTFRKLKVSVNIIGTYLHCLYLLGKFNLNLLCWIAVIIADAILYLLRITIHEHFLVMASSILANAVRGLPLFTRVRGVRGSAGLLRSAGLLGTTLLSPTLHSPTRILKASSIWKLTLHRAAYMSFCPRLEAVKSWVHTRQTNRQGRLILSASVNWFQSSHLNIKPSPAGSCQGRTLHY